VEALAGMLGLQKVGWIFSHPTREKGFHFSGGEIMFAAEQQLEAARGVGDTPFVTLKLTIDEASQIMVEAFQVSQQCMEMVAEGVITPGSNLGSVAVNDTFTAIVEGRESKEVDNNFFLSTTPIEQFDSEFLVASFPRVNRVDVMQLRDDIKTQFRK
jgi:nuclear protein localization family protein 4